MSAQVHEGALESLVTLPASSHGCVVEQPGGLLVKHQLPEGHGVKPIFKSTLLLGDKHPFRNLLQSLLKF